LVPKREVILELLRESGQQFSDDVSFSSARIGEGRGFASLIYKNHIKLPKYYGGRHCNGSEEGIVIIEDFTGRMIPNIEWLNGFSIELFPASDKAPVYHAMTIFNFRKLHSFADDIGKLTEEYPEFAENAPRTLIHCDPWRHNMVYDRRATGLGLLAMVDWQTFTIRNTLFDVSVLCAISLTAEVRRANEKELTHKLYRHCLKWCALLLSSMTVFLKEDDVPDGHSEDGPITARIRALLEDLDD
ncbi:hypothetical protein PENTCL1PPCAC_14278, partial [Pristionchus entomophagus]